MLKALRPAKRPGWMVSPAALGAFLRPHGLEMPPQIPEVGEASYTYVYDTERHEIWFIDDACWAHVERNNEWLFMYGTDRLHRRPLMGGAWD